MAVEPEIDLEDLPSKGSSSQHADEEPEDEGHGRDWLTLAKAVTPLGWMLLLVGIIALVLGIVLHWTEFSQLGAVALALVALGLAWVNLPGTADAAVTVDPRRLTEGGKVATAKVEVKAKAIPLLAPRVEIPVGEQVIVRRLPFLAPYQSQVDEFELPQLRRGVYEVGPVRHSKTDPLGLARRPVEETAALELLVAPRITDLALFAGGMTSDLDGAVSDELSMSDLAFHALREYVPGDDLRHVHWRSSAKADQLLTRQYHETRRGHVTVLVDQSPDSYADEEDFELAVSVATSIAVRAAKDDFDTYFRCGQHLVAGRSPVAVVDLSCRFALDDSEYGAVVAAAVRDAPRTGLVMQVTGTNRSIADLHKAAQRFAKGAESLVLRAETAGKPGFADHRFVKEIRVHELGRLPSLIQGAMR